MLWRGNYIRYCPSKGVRQVEEVDKEKEEEGCEKHFVVCGWEKDKAQFPRNKKQNKMHKRKVKRRDVKVGAVGKQTNCICNK